MADFRDWLLGGMFSPENRAQMAERERQHRNRVTLEKIMRAPLPGMVFNPDARGPDELPVLHGAKQLIKSIAGVPETIINTPFKLAADANRWAKKETAAIADQAFTTDRQRQSRQQAAVPANNVFPNSYADPRYDQAELAAAKATGVPVELLRRIRMNGERSNNDQVSSAGARSPYQIIPKTAAGIKRNYGIDPFSSPENAALAAAYVLKEQAGKNADWSNPATMARAAGGYFGGAAGANNPFGNISDGGTNVAEYVGRVLGDGKDLAGMYVNPAAAATPFNQAAMGEINNMERALLTPFSTTIDKGPAPDMPVPEAIPTTDFRASDAALENLKPLEMTEKEKLRLERDGWFKGLANAMMNMSGNEGIGTFLMKVGGATLAGREAGRDEIRERQDKFETKMAQYNAAVYQHETGKANTIANELRAQVQQNNQYALAQYNVARNDWDKNNSFDISGTNTVHKFTDPQTGKQTINVVPIPSLVQASMAQMRAAEYARQGSQAVTGASQVTGQINSLVTGVAGRVISSAVPDGSTAQEQAIAAAAAPAQYATHIVHYGKAPELLGEERYGSLDTDVRSRLKTMKILPGSEEYQTRYEQMMAEELTNRALIDPAFLTDMSDLAGGMTALEAARARRTRRENVDAKSRRSYSETTVFDDE